MANGILLYDDQSDDITFSGPSWTLPLTNMQDPRLSKVARSSNAAVENTKFFMAYPDPITLEYFILDGTNIDEDATILVTTYTDSEFSLLDYTSEEQAAWTSSDPIFDPDAKGVPIILPLGQAVTAAYWECDIINPTNADGYVQMGGIFHGRRLMNTYNFAPQSSFKRDPRTSIQRALAGTPYFNRHKNARSYQLNYPNETQDVFWDEMDKLNELSGLDRPVFVIPFPDDEERRQRQSFRGTLTAINDAQMLMVDLMSTGFSIEEYVG